MPRHTKTRANHREPENYQSQKLTFSRTLLLICFQHVYWIVVSCKSLRHDQWARTGGTLCYKTASRYVSNPVSESGHIQSYSTEVNGSQRKSTEVNGNRKGNFSSIHFNIIIIRMMLLAKLVVGEIFSFNMNIHRAVILPSVWVDSKLPT